MRDAPPRRTVAADPPCCGLEASSLNLAGFPPPSRLHRFRKGLGRPSYRLETTPRRTMAEGGAAPAAALSRPAPLKRQATSRHATLDDKGVEVVKPGCFTRNVMRSPCACCPNACIPMWATFVLAVVLAAIPNLTGAITIDATGLAGLDTDAIPEIVAWYAWRKVADSPDKYYAPDDGRRLDSWKPRARSQIEPPTLKLQHPLGSWAGTRDRFEPATSQLQGRTLAEAASGAPHSTDVHGEEKDVWLWFEGLADADMFTADAIAAQIEFERALLNADSWGTHCAKASRPTLLAHPYTPCRAVARPRARCSLPAPSAHAVRTRSLRPGGERHGPYREPALRLGPDDPPLPAHQRRPRAAAVRGARRPRQPPSLAEPPIGTPSP